jgi:hypothetical protein
MMDHDIRAWMYIAIAFIFAAALNACFFYTDWTYASSTTTLYASPP